MRLDDNVAKRRTMLTVTPFNDLYRIRVLRMYVLIRHLTPHFKRPALLQICHHQSNILTFCCELRTESAREDDGTALIATNQSRDRIVVRRSSDYNRRFSLPAFPVRRMISAFSQNSCRQIELNCAVSWAWRCGASRYVTLASIGRNRQADALETGRSQTRRHHL